MQFNVATLLREPTGSERRYAIEPEGAIRGGDVELIRTPGGVLVRARAEAVREDVCSRCLVPLAYPVRVVFEEVFYQQVDLVSGHRRKLPDDPDAFLISTAHLVDISEAVRQYSEAAAVIQPLCRADCPGLCPVCGTDLSTRSCDCNREQLDPRWAALGALKRSPG